MNLKHLDKENIIVLGIALVLLIAWGVWYPKYTAKQEAAMQKRPARAPQSEAQMERTAATKQGAAAKADADQTVPAPPLPQYPPVTLDNGLAAFTIAPAAGSVEKVVLHRYYRTAAKPKDRIKIVFDASLAPHRTAAVDLPDWRTTALTVIRPRSADSPLVIDHTLRRGGDQVKMLRTFSLPKDSYSLDMKLQLVNPGSAVVTLPVLRVWAAGMPPMRQFGGDKAYLPMHRIEYCGAVSQQMVSLDPAMKDDKFKKAATALAADWLGVTNKYFASLLFANPAFTGGVDFERIAYPDQSPGAKAGALYYVPAAGGIYKNLALNPGETVTFSFRYFAGPKTLAEVKKLPKSAMGILHISRFSWMEYLGRPMLWLLNYLNSLCGSYGVAIILLTLLVRIVFFPLTERGNRSMRKMAKIAPRAKEIREKYKNNPQLMNQKTMELYKSEGINPLGGCLPILLQIPVFFALYAALDSAVELRHVSFLWITDLTKPDLTGPKFFFGHGIHPLVIAMTVLMIVQQKMSPSHMESAQQKMMLAMPILMLIFLYNLPAGLTLYWTVSQIFSIAQLKYSLYIAKRDEGETEPPVPSPSA